MPSGLRCTSRAVFFLTFAALCGLALLSGCGGGSSPQVTPPPAAISVAVSQTTASVAVGQTQTFSATVANDSQNKGVTWALSGAGCSGPSCGTLSATSSASGASITYTAPASVPSPATVTLTATSVADTSQSAAVTITITGAAPAIKVSVSPTTATVQVGSGQNFSATVQNDSQNKGVKWSLSGAGCSGSSCGTLSATASASGTPITYTAPANVPSPAAVTLTATSVTDSTKSAAATITISAGAQAIAVSVSPTTATVQVSTAQNFSATVQNDSQNKGVTWALSGTGCSGTSCGTLSTNASASGGQITYTAPASVPSPATVTLTATSVMDATKSAAATITVSVTPPGGITVTISPVRGGLTLSQPLNFTAAVANDPSNSGVSWSASGNCSGNACGTFTNVTPTSATYTAPSTAGVYSITATSQANTTVSAAATIGVTDMTGMTTYHNDLARDGVNSHEYALTLNNVATGTFGKLFSCATDSDMYTQPLWVANLSIGGGTHNVIFAASSHDTVYAFDADASPCVTYWSKSLLNAGEVYLNAYNDTAGPNAQIQPDVGIVGTPVIDPVAKILYVVSQSKQQPNIACLTNFGGTNSGDEQPSCQRHQRLHALSLIDGSEQASGPVDITSSITVPGTGVGGNGTSVSFDPIRENQRSGLALVNGIVYVEWASYADLGDYHGWILGFNASNISAPPIIFNDTPNGSSGGIWMAGGAPAADSNNNMYLLTGNGDWDGMTEFGDSFLKLSTSGGLSVADYFTPYDQANLDVNDLEPGSGGAVVLVDLPAPAPFPHLMIGGGKAGSGNLGQLYVVNRDNMGHYISTGNTQVVQQFPVGGGLWATGAFYQNVFYIGGTPGNAYYPVTAFTLNPTTGLFNTTPMKTTFTIGYPGATPAISASGSSNVIMWVLNNNGFFQAGSAVLYAVNGTTMQELWDSSMVPGDAAGNAVKFTVPTIVNGKVYIGTSGEIDVYGLLSN